MSAPYGLERTSSVFTQDREIEVLLVEDSRADAFLVKDALEHSALVDFKLNHVLRLTDAIEAMQVVLPDVVLLDLSLPDAQGLGSLGRIRSVNTTVPIVVMTDLDDSEIALKAVADGAQDFLVKGQLDMRSLVRAICYAIDRQQMLLELQKARKREEHRATHDALTGLPNRLLFYDRLRQAVVDADRRSEKLVILFLDVDDFKNVNDSFGHAQGDVLLQTVARRFRGALRKNDTVARIGGDEFTGLLLGIKNCAYIEKVVDKVVRSVTQPIVLSEEPYQISVSVGVSVYPEDGTDADSLLVKADAAMYRAKRTDGARYELTSVAPPVCNED